MAEYGEWSRKGATLSDVTASKEYGVDSDFIVKGINAGKLEYREGAIHGNPYIRVLRGQLEAYIAEELGDDYLRRWQAGLPQMRGTRAREKVVVSRCFGGWAGGGPCVYRLRAARPG